MRENAARAPADQMIASVWATGVLDRLARPGRAACSEITDAAMGERAECVMLNEGPRIVEALDDILRRIERHQCTQRSLLAARGLGPAITFAPIVDVSHAPPRPRACAAPRSSATARIRVAVHALTGANRSGSCLPTVLAINQMMNQMSGKAAQTSWWTGASTRSASSTRRVE